VALFDDAAEVKTTDVYRARPFELYQVAEARDRILRRLAAIPEGAPLARFCRTHPKSPRLRRGKIAPAVGLVEHVDRRVGIGQAGRCGAGAGGDFATIRVTLV
jgi:hypothetical protein